MMGYSFEFDGEFSITPALSSHHRNYLLAFSDTRRVRRDLALLIGVADPLRAAAGLPMGLEGAYFIGTRPARTDDAHPESIVDVNIPPVGQPGLWCNWAPTESGDALVWNEVEKFAAFDEWAGYLIEHFLGPWGYTLNGQVKWQGDHPLDQGVLAIRRNVVDTLGAITVAEGDDIRRLKVFLCHASEDKHRVKRLRDRLRDDNIDPWLDEHQLLPGCDWNLELERAMRAADAVIVCLSPDSVRKRGYVQREIRMAIAAAEEQPEGELFLFPLLLGDCEVPDSLRRWQTLDLRKRGAYGRLLAALGIRATALSSFESPAP
jgi:hypothetical protein